MNNGDFFSQQNVPNDGTWHVDARQHTLIVKGYHGQVVDLEAVGHVSDAVSWFVKVGYDNNFVTQLEQTLR